MFFAPFTIINKFRSQTPKGFYDAKKGHTGVDIDMPSGTEINSPLTGKVVGFFAQNEMGNCLYIQEEITGDIHVFAHLTKALVKMGEFVTIGYPIAVSGNTGGKSTSPHLHYEIIAKHPTTGLEFMTRTLQSWSGYNIDPEQFLNKSKVEAAHSEEETGLAWAQKYFPQFQWSEQEALKTRAVARQIIKWVREG